MVTYAEREKAPITLPPIKREKPKTQKRKRQYTAEEKKAVSDRLKAMRQDPEFEARRVAAIRAAAARRKADPVEREKMLANFKKNELKRLAAIRAYNHTRFEKEEERRKCAENIKRLWENGVLIEAAKKHKRSPQGMANCIAATRRMHDRKRGFKIPPLLRTRYRELVQVKKLSAREAGRVLGLI